MYAMSSAPVRASGERRTPIHFGADESRLFGCYHEPGLGAGRDCAVVLCYPFGQEYIRAHRSFVQLATRLASAGFTVLRFDYFGCGDSTGELEDATIDRWTDDIAAAVAEVRNRSGSSRVNVIGLRLGAALAAITAARRDDIDSLVLWDPLVQGADYLAEICRTHQAALDHAYVTPPAGPSRPELTEVSGFPLTRVLRDGIEALDLLSLEGITARRVFLLESGLTPAVAALKDRLSSASVACEHEHIAERKVWLREPTGGIVPHRLLEAVTRWMCEADS